MFTTFAAHSQDLTPLMEKHSQLEPRHIEPVVMQFEFAEHVCRDAA